MIGLPWSVAGNMAQVQCFVRQRTVPDGYRSGTRALWSADYLDHDTVVR